MITGQSLLIQVLIYSIQVANLLKINHLLQRLDKRITAVDDYADLLMMSIASAGNDQRLEQNEAPPPSAIISMSREELDALSRNSGEGKKTSAT